MKQGWLATSFDALFSWARANSLRFFSVHTGCCSDELLQAMSCRYDIERFGALPEADPVFSDLLIVSGAISKKAAPEILRVYEQMPSPKYVIALGSCACSGGAFSSQSTGGQTLDGASSVVPVDIFVPGCPPRPEAVLEGLIRLQEKISGRKILPRKPGRRQARLDRPEADEWDLR